ncbi:MAG: hypothetical protein JXA68_11650 [Ignavibacteriales bacterium]|nr:hypothetical protein [Ignavibacteriales bacterium]
MRYKFKILLFVSFSGIFFSIYAQTSLETQYYYANNLYQNKLYFDAVTEFKRLLFFDEGNKYSYEVSFKIGDSYKQGARFDDAIKYFTLADINAKEDSQRFNAQIEIVKVNILRRTTDRALQLLDSMDANYRFYNKKDEINYWRGWTYMFADDWKKASKCFAQIDYEHELRKLSDAVHKEKYSEPLAKILSFFIPGAGQIYTKHYFSGALSLAWNLLFGYLTIDAFVEDRVFDGVIVGSLLWLRFYQGNYQNAEKFAKEENIKIINNAYRYLQNEYQGEKP